MDIIKEFFKYCSKSLDAQPVDGWDIYLSEDKSRQIACREYEVEDYKESVELGYSIRVMKDHKISFAYGNDLSIAAVTRKIKEVVALNALSLKDDSLVMPQSIVEATQSIGIDDSYDSVPVKEKEETLRKLEKIIREADNRITNVEHLGFSESCGTLYYQVKGSELKQQSSSFYGFEGEVIAEADGQMESGGGFSYQTRLAQIDIPKLAGEIVENTTSMLGSSAINSGECKVVFRNDVSAMFLSTFASLFSADQVHNNKSVLKDRIGEQIASSKFNLEDDGSIEDTIGYYLFDGEGVSGQRTELINDGVLAGYLYDLKTAKKDGVNPTGNAVRGSYDSMPSIKPTNLIVKAGESSLDELLNKDRVLLVTNVMGMHTSNTINGEFSVGATGILYENGKIVQSVKQITIAGDFLKLLSSVEELGSDTDNFPYNGNIITPSWYIESLMISGL